MPAGHLIRSLLPITVAGALCACSTPMPSVQPTEYRGITFNATITDHFGISVYATLEAHHGPEVTINELDLRCVQLTLYGATSEWADQSGIGGTGGPLKFDRDGKLSVPVNWSFTSEVRAPLPPATSTNYLKVTCIRWSAVRQ
ncbi:hypothetical protein BH10PSE17_BH10PSE17_10850 [soil metagenome]